MLINYVQFVTNKSNNVTLSAPYAVIVGHNGCYRLGILDLSVVDHVHQIIDLKGFHIDILIGIQMLACPP